MASPFLSKGEVAFAVVVLLGLIATILYVIYE